MKLAPYAYGENKFIVDDSFKKKKKLLDFSSRLCYVRGVIPTDEAGKKCLKCLIYVSLLMEYHSREGCQTAFGKLIILFILHR